LIKCNTRVKILVERKIIKYNINDKKEKRKIIQRRQSDKD